MPELNELVDQLFDRSDDQVSYCIETLVGDSGPSNAADATALLLACPPLCARPRTMIDLC